MSEVIIIADSSDSEVEEGEIIEKTGPRCNCSENINSKVFVNHICAVFPKDLPKRYQQFDDNASKDSKQNKAEKPKYKEKCPKFSKDFSINSQKSNSNVKNKDSFNRNFTFSKNSQKQSYPTFPSSYTPKGATKTKNTGQKEIDYLSMLSDFKKRNKLKEKCYSPVDTKKKSRRKNESKRKKKFKPKCESKHKSESNRKKPCKHKKKTTSKVIPEIMIEDNEMEEFVEEAVIECNNNCGADSSSETVEMIWNEIKDIAQDATTQVLKEPNNLRSRNMNNEVIEEEFEEVEISTYDSDCEIEDIAEYELRKKALESVLIRRKNNEPFPVQSSELEISGNRVKSEIPPKEFENCDNYEVIDMEVDNDDTNSVNSCNNMFVIDRTPTFEESSSKNTVPKLDKSQDINSLRAKLLENLNMNTERRKVLKNSMIDKSDINTINYIANSKYKASEQNLVFGYSKKIKLNDSSLTPNSNKSFLSLGDHTRVSMHTSFSDIISKYRAASKAQSFAKVSNSKFTKLTQHGKNLYSKGSNTTFQRTIVGFNSTLHKINYPKHREPNKVNNFIPQNMDSEPNMDRFQNKTHDGFANSSNNLIQHANRLIINLTNETSSDESEDDTSDTENSNSAANGCNDLIALLVADARKEIENEDIDSQSHFDENKQINGTLSHLVTDTVTFDHKVSVAANVPQAISLGNSKQIMDMPFEQIKLSENSKPLSELNECIIPTDILTVMDEIMKSICKDVDINSEVTVNMTTENDGIGSEIILQSDQCTLQYSNDSVKIIASNENSNECPMLITNAKEKMPCEVTVNCRMERNTQCLNIQDNDIVFNTEQEQSKLDKIQIQHPKHKQNHNVDKVVQITPNQLHAPEHAKQMDLVNKKLEIAIQQITNTTKELQKRKSIFMDSKSKVECLKKQLAGEEKLKLSNFQKWQSLAAQMKLLKENVANLLYLKDSFEKKCP